MDILFEIWLRLFEVYAEDLFFQGESSGVFSFLLIGVLAYLFKQEKTGQSQSGNGCTCCRKEREKKQTDESSQ
ncbi:hypothetical protein JOC95_003418 [Bacillus tianshenii]|uniref:Uncharacterized protein n=1 Tax=Sutcliffiella tianshenii TaxID=1463404 RepID=A0ABS2P3S8_9BACI|nr:hypothetical protein [Bacillus tianshenii]MBM7621529.1 hypothetical protein [Bacillus tianshenii]MCA1319179.1 hypothetical protein [Bacillus tianshenii]